jgi:hypothetical protein
VSPETARPCRGGWRRDHPLAGVRCRGQRQCLWRLQDHVEAAGEGIIFLQEYDVEEESTIFERSRSGDCNIEEVVRAKKDIKKRVVFFQYIPSTFHMGDSLWRTSKIVILNNIILHM